MSCKFDLNEETCLSAKNLIKKYYKKYNTCSECKLSDGVQHLIDIYDSLVPEEKIQLTQIITSLDVKVKKCQSGKKSDFKCPCLNTYINVDCSLTGCRYFIDYTWSNNCVLSFILNQERSTLTTEEVSFLYKIPVNKVKSTYLDAITAIKRKVLNDSINAPRFVYYPSDRVCCVCECNIKKHLDRINQIALPSHLVDCDIGIVYCSDECLHAKPKKLIELEIEFETHISNIIKAAIVAYKDIKVITNILDITPTLLSRSCIRYLGKEPDEILKNYVKNTNDDEDEDDDISYDEKKDDVYDFI
jgi:hypothetical protein